MIRSAAIVCAVLVFFTAVPATAASAETDDASGRVVVLEPGGVGPFTAGVVASVARVAGGEAAVVHQDTVRLFEVRRGATVVQSAPEGFGFPLAAVWMDPARAEPVVSAAASAALATGSVVMSERSAALRGARTGDTVVVEGADGVSLEASIGAVLPDGELSWNELALPVDLAAAAGLWRPSRIIVYGLADAGRVVRVLEFLLPDPIRVWAPSDGFPSRDWVLPTVLIKERFGEFSYRPGPGDAIEIDPAWLSEHVVWADIDPIGRFRCHVEVVPYLRAAFAELASRGMLDAIDVRDFRRAGGCFNPRLLRGANAGTSVSRHAWGIAIDLNPSSNRYGGPVSLPPKVGDVFRSWGFAWGAGWTVPDGMHFEWQREPEGRCSPFLAATPAASGDVYARGAPCAPS
jgi:hypothetical protein